MLKVSLLLFIFTIAGIYGAPADNESKWEWRIVGGQNSDIVPYQVSLRSSLNSHFCGGTIITPRTILTAAHCIVGRTTTNTNVVVGTTTLNSGGTRYSTSSLKVHAQYNQNTIQNDIGLVIVSSNIEMSSSVQSIPIGRTTIDGDVPVTLTGWGTTTYPGSAPNNLQTIDLLTITVSDCQSRLSGIGTVFSTQVCTFTKAGEGACHGDSGGPLVADGAVIGIVSWGSPCAKGYPDVFTRVSSYATWIDTNSV